MAPKPISQNTLFYGDNLPILREHIADESVDLIYLDPPFNSSRTYNVLFKEENGTASDAQIQAFDDTWHWGQSAEAIFNELRTQAPEHVGTMIDALHRFVGANQMMAYLVMMAIRLIELHRVLKPTGSLYLHCDPTASHYLKILLDTIFGPQNFRTEIVWKRSSAHSDTKQGRMQHGRIHDIIFFYTKSDEWIWVPQYTPYDQEYLDAFYKYTEPGTGRKYRLGDLTGPGGAAKGNPQYEVMGVTRYWRYSKEKMEELIRQGRVIQTKPGAVPAYKRYIDEMPGVPLQDIWTDIPPIGPQAAERLDYPTQKPEALLERIIKSSSIEGSLVLDPFCGCGTAIVGAHKLGRRWIGIDITHLAIALQKYRMEAMFPGIEFEVHGEPRDIAAARQLASEDKYQFQWWALSLIKARPVGAAQGSREGKKGSDRGIDGVINFIDDPKGKLSRLIVQVKGGGVKSGDIRDLKGTIEREQAPIAVFITLEEPTREMQTEALSAGFYHSDVWQKDYPKLQILTVDQLLSGAEVKMPPQHGTFKQAPKADQSDATQTELAM